MTKPCLSLSIVVGLALMLAIPVLAVFQEGEDAYKRGDYETALKEFWAVAAQGDAAAQNWSCPTFVDRFLKSVYQRLPFPHDPPPRELSIFSDVSTISGIDHPWRSSALIIR